MTALLLLAALPAAGAAALAGYYFYCLLSLRRLASRPLAATADFTFGPGAPLLGALQHRAEILPFLEWACPVPPRAVAEIGRAQGGTLALLCRAAAPDALVVSLDLPGGAWAGQLPFLNKGFWRRPLLEALRGPGQDLRLIDGDSHLPETRERFRAALGGRRLDLLLIDGDHSFEGVKRDYEMYREFVRPGGVIAFHDVHPGWEQAGVEVSRFWRGLETPGERAEFVADRAQLSYGIGAVRLPA